MRIVETDQPGPIRGVQRQRVVESVRTFRSDIGSRRAELHPVPCFVHEQRLTVKVEQRVESRVTVSRLHYIRLSLSDNTVVYHTDMVLYYLKHSVPNKPGPEELIDDNVRIDYGKLRHLLTVGRRLNGNFDLLRHVIADGQADSAIATSFPQARLDQRENFLSLMHYFGLLSIRGVTAGVPQLGIPNQTVRRLMYGYLRDAYRDVGVFSLDLVEFDRLTRRMALEGEWRPAVERLSAAVAEHTGISAAGSWRMAKR